MYQLGHDQTSMVYAQTTGTLTHFMLIQPPNLVQHSDSIPSQQMNEVLENPLAWYLVDGPVYVASLFRVEARVLQVTSPDRKHFKDFLKAPADQYFMPVWTHDELEDCRQNLYPSVTQENLMQLERIAGPIPRFVLEGPSASFHLRDGREQLSSTPSRFTKAHGDLIRLTTAAVDRMSLDDIISAVGAVDANDVKVTYRALQIEVDSTSFASIGLRLASPFVEQLFLTRMTQVNLDGLWRTYQKASGSIQGSLYEAWAHRILSGSGQTKLSIRSLDKNATNFIEIGDRKLLLQQTYEQMTQMDIRTYGVPASKTFAAIDAVCLP
jgi:hypothetical protein